ncbi:MAG: pantetheine-phosphate adenylyltransferase [Bacteroidales bacterium]|nr:pantetheine-phosphate adenylyltransferase [Bacteroidales bacterium]
MKTALFPGSFDPFTLGHLDVLQSALKLFDKVIVAVGYNYNKKGFFPLDIRVEIIKDAIKGLDKVEVRAFDGLTVDFCKKVGANCIIRGIRTTTDFELESVIAQANKQMAPEISSVFIPSSHDYSFISSTVVRDVLINGGDARCFLPKNVDITKYLEYLEK